MPDFPTRIVGRAVAIPDHVGDHGGAMVRDDHDLEAVCQGVMGNLRGGGLDGHRDPKVPWGPAHDGGSAPCQFFDI